MNWIKFTKLYFTFSLLLIIVGVYSLTNWGLKLGVDFTGGGVIEYRFSKEISTEEITDKLESEGLKVSSIQQVEGENYLFKTPPLQSEDKDKINNTLKSLLGEESVEEIRYESVGPAIGPELIKKTIYAIVIAASGILLWVAFQFKSIKFGISAVLAMIHDTFLLISSFSIFGRFYGAEVDFLFVTALLTTLSFSVHDTIVVFDRIRELKKNEGDSSIVNLANKALSETMVRSLNNSFTIVFMLAALLLLGGTTVKWFAVALLVGTIFGTYSSPFIAVPLLVVWSKLSVKKD